MDSANKCTILLLGTYHMGNPGLDMHNVESDDVLALKRQKEIYEVVDRLKLFNPTKIAVEALADEHEAYNNQYLSYLSGEFSLGANEIHQLGFRTAADLGHDRIYPIDWNEWYGGVALGHVYEYAQSNMPELYQRLNSNNQEKAEALQKSMKEKTVRELLMSGNTPSAIQGDHETYMTVARVGDGKNNIGIDWLCNYWYRRNLIIYSNISRISSHQDRILVIYGSGHIHLLTQFIKESGLFLLESVEKYLGDR
ncbi:DUF5694 domain-containing protein [Paenibacillus lautus]|uniref:DUF5694 domain-containing protein n=1 Tax=Paenibacillus lautus TaxID=1401 RepID=UPI001C0FDE03|nr:DUF5694 domain-containing protein [Paenibacillus lautus]MBU5345859.1 hypothetical protein [Paenibacillus lautus]